MTESLVIAAMDFNLLSVLARDLYSMDQLCCIAVHVKIMFSNEILLCYSYSITIRDIMKN